MSGIAGIVNFDGAPVRRAILDRMADYLAWRGPDRTGVRSQGTAGLVHTLFATTEEAGRERQPLNLDDRFWITADARIDGRGELIAELCGHGCPCSSRSTDPELILHAYAVWGEQCVEHLLGDFAFAIWDALEQKLFCARDHFGVRPFFYAHTSQAFVFGNAFDVPRLHPSVPDDVYEPAIGDFLAIGTGVFDPERTVREAIRRLPPAHVLVVANGEARKRRYWSLPVDPPTVFRRSRDYVDRFLELFTQAVGDRLRTGRVAVLMSGGLDSSSVAAVAKRAAQSGGLPCSLSAHTETFHRLFPYEEGHFARLAAQKIGIPWNETPLDNRQLLGYWDRPGFRRPEPWLTPLFDSTLSDSLGATMPARVVLTGQGGDGIFSSLRLRHCRERMRNGQWLRLTGEVSRYMLSEGRLRRLQLLGHLYNLSGRRIPPRPFPAWVSPDFERRLNLRERYAQFEQTPVWNSVPKDVVRPEAYGLMSGPVWPGLFREFDPEVFGACAEVRHPFFDLRLVRYVLSLPALPWCTDKELMRRSMRGLLPDEVRLAGKRPLNNDLLTTFYRSSRKPWLENFEPVKDLSRYIDVDRARQYARNPGPWELVVHLRPICLNYWLKWETDYAYKLQREDSRVHTS